LPEQPEGERAKDLWARKKYNGTQIDDDLYAAGGTITINGDVIAAGGTITISGPVHGSVRSAGGTLTINGPDERNMAIGLHDHHGPAVAGHGQV